MDSVWPLLDLGGFSAGADERSKAGAADAILVIDSDVQIFSKGWEHCFYC